MQGRVSILDTMQPGRDAWSDGVQPISRPSSLCPAMTCPARVPLAATTYGPPARAHEGGGGD